MVLGLQATLITKLELTLRLKHCIFGVNNMFISWNVCISIFIYFYIIILDIIALQLCFSFKEASVSVINTE